MKYAKFLRPFSQNTFRRLLLLTANKKLSYAEVVINNNTYKPNLLKCGEDPLRMTEKEFILYSSIFCITLYIQYFRLNYFQLGQCKNSHQYYALFLTNKLCENCKKISKNQQISQNFPNFRSVFRTLSNIYDGAFFRKQLMGRGLFAKESQSEDSRAYAAPLLLMNLRKIYEKAVCNHLIYYSLCIILKIRC